jgi:hypothetical protein
VGAAHAGMRRRAAGEEPTYCGVTMSELIEQVCLPQAAANKAQSQGLPPHLLGLPRPAGHARAPRAAGRAVGPGGRGRGRAEEQAVPQAAAASARVLQCPPPLPSHVEPVQNANVGDVLALLWFKRRLPKYASQFMEMWVAPATTWPAAARRTRCACLTCCCSLPELLLLLQQLLGGITARCRSERCVCQQAMHHAVWLPGTGARTQPPSPSAPAPSRPTQPSPPHPPTPPTPPTSRPPLARQVRHPVRGPRAVRVGRPQRHCDSARRQGPHQLPGAPPTPTPTPCLAWRHPLHHPSHLPTPCATLHRPAPFCCAGTPQQLGGSAGGADPAKQAQLVRSRRPRCGT